MTIATATASDLELRDAIIRELDWDSQFDASEIGVSARGRAVTLTGSIDSYAAKLAAERAVKGIVGVRAVANDTIALRGRVRSWTEHDAAERAAMHAPGAAAIDNQLAVVSAEPGHVERQAR